MKKWSAFIFAVVILLIVHEGTHALIAAIYNEYEAFRIRPVGMEVIMKTPVNERGGIQWAFISGTSNVATLLMGYLLLMLGKRFARLRSLFLKTGIYYLTLISLLADAFNLSIGPFIYGGDINGIVAGFGINRFIIQGFFLLIFLANRELIVRKLLPIYNVKTGHFLLRPWTGGRNQ